MKKVQQANIEPYPYVRRLAAFLVDWYTSSFLAMIPVLVFQSINGKDLVLENSVLTLSPWQAIAASILAALIYLWYFCGLPLRAPGGLTPGRRLLQVRLEKVNGNALTFRDLFLRDFVGILFLQGNITSVNIYFLSLAEKFSGSGAFLPYVQTFYTFLLIISLVLLFTGRKQTIYDWISGTRIARFRNDAIQLVPQQNKVENL